MPGSGVTTGGDTLHQDQWIRFGNPDIQNVPAPTSFGAGAQTVTAAQLIASIVSGAPTTAVNYTLDSTANILAALKKFSDMAGARIGDTFNCMIANAGSGSGAITIVAGDAKTVVTKTGAVAVGTNQNLIFYVSDPTGAATPSITVYG